MMKPNMSFDHNSIKGWLHKQLQCTWAGKMDLDGS